VVLACDLRIGLLGIEWRMPATALGLHYYPSGLQRYVSRFGLAATKRAFLTARPFTDRQLEGVHAAHTRRLTCNCGVACTTHLHYPTGVFN
jgi:enoyl-CoA hydratase/carnithine racemase